MLENEAGLPESCPHRSRRASRRLWLAPPYGLAEGARQRAPGDGKPAEMADGERFCPPARTGGRGRTCRRDGESRRLLETKAVRQSGGRRRGHGREPGDGGGPQGAAEAGVLVCVLVDAVAVEDRVDDVGGELGRAVVVAVEVDAVAIGAGPGALSQRGGRHGGARDPEPGRPDGGA